MGNWLANTFPAAILPLTTSVRDPLEKREATQVTGGDGYQDGSKAISIEMCAHTSCSRTTVKWEKTSNGMASPSPRWVRK